MCEGVVNFDESESIIYELSIEEVPTEFKRSDVLLIGGTVCFTNLLGRLDVFEDGG